MQPFAVRTPIRRPSDILPAPILAEMRRIAAHKGELYQMMVNSAVLEDRFLLRWAQGIDSWLIRSVQGRIPDMGNVIGLINWIREGPKIVDVTEAQYQALANVEVRLDLCDYEQPFPTVMVNLPPGHLQHACLLSMLRAECGEKCLVTSLISGDGKNDVATFVTVGREMESILVKFSTDCADSAHISTPNLRVAVNMMLAMVNFGCAADYLFPKEVDAERKFMRKGDRPSRDGRRASDRLREQPLLVTLDRSVKLYHREGGHPDGEHGGAEQPFHWRRGHWRMAWVGKGRQERRRVFVRPCMVRADLLTTAAPADTTTTYRK